MESNIAAIEPTVTQPEVKKVAKPRAAKKVQAETKAAPAAKTPAKAAKTTPAKKVEGVQSLTGGGARPAIFMNTLSKAIADRYPTVAKLAERLHIAHNVRTVAFFVSYRPDPQKSARLSDWFKISWAKAGKDSDLPKNMATSQQLSIGNLVKVDAALAFTGKLNEPIVYLTLEKGSKKISINGSFKK